MNHFLFTSWFLQNLWKKKIEMETEEEKKVDKHKANIIVTMATINIKIVAMDSLVFIFLCFISC